MMRLKIALRNIARHRGRTFVSLMMVIGAVVGLVLFAGFADYILGNMQRIVIDNEFGHIQIGKRAYWDLTGGNRKEQLMPDAKGMAVRISALEGVDRVAGRLAFYGLTSTGETTISAKGMGYDPRQESEFGKNLTITSGRGLDASSKLEAIVGTGLQRRLNAEVGKTITVLAYTLDGVVNAMDLTVKGVFSTSVTEIDNNVFMLPLVTAQSLLDTDRVEVLSIRVKRTPDASRIRDRIQQLLNDPGEHAGNTYQAKTWYELSKYYRQVESFYATQNMIIKVILMSLVFLGIMNTVGMSVYERTGEIGTIRALGETGSSVILQFALEGALLGCLGALLGAVAGAGACALVTSLGLLMDVPGTSEPVRIAIYQVPGAYLEAILLVTLASIAATWIPSLKAVKSPIVDALRRNI